MLPDRSTEIMNCLTSMGYCTIHDLARIIHTSDATIRRELIAMEEAGLVIRVYGGVIPAKSARYQPVDIRKSINLTGKQAIGRQAVALIQDDSAVYFDAGSTILAMLPFLHRKMKITVASPSLDACRMLMDMGFDTYCIGGHIDKQGHAQRGKYALDMVKQMHFDQMFFSCSAVSSDGLLTTHSENCAILLQTVMQNCKERIFCVIPPSSANRTCISLPILPAWTGSFPIYPCRRHWLKW